MKKGHILTFGLISLFIISSLVGCFGSKTTQNDIVSVAPAVVAGGAAAGGAANVVGAAKCDLYFTNASDATDVIVIKTNNKGAQMVEFTPFFLDPTKTYNIGVDLLEDGTIDYTVPGFAFAGTKSIARLFLDNPATSAVPVILSVITDSTAAVLEQKTIALPAATVNNTAALAAINVKTILTGAAASVTTQATYGVVVDAPANTTVIPATVTINNVATVTNTVIPAAVITNVTTNTTTVTTTIADTTYVAPKVTASSLTHATNGDIDNDKKLSKGDVLSVNITMNKADTYSIQATVTGDVYKIVAQKANFSTGATTFSLTTTQIGTTTPDKISVYKKVGTAWVLQTSSDISGFLAFGHGAVDTTMYYGLNVYGTFAYNIAIQDSKNGTVAISGSATIQP